MIALLHLALFAPFESALRPLGAAGPDLARYFVVCALLVVLLGALLLALRKGLAAKVKARAARRSLSVIDVLPLGGRQKVLVLRCYDRTFLLGVGDKELTAIAELDSAIGLEPAAPKQGSPADREAFARALETIRRTLPGPKLGPRVGTKLVPSPPRDANGVASEPSTPAPSRAQVAVAAQQGQVPANPVRATEANRPRLEGVVG